VQRTARRGRSGQASIPLENGLLLFDEGAVGALKILSLHADGLGLRFRLDRLFDAHRPLLIELGLGDSMRECGTGSNTGSEIERFRLEFRSLDQSVIEAPAVALAGRHGAAGVKKLRGTALPDDTRQDGTGTHVAAGKADAGEEE